MKGIFSLKGKVAVVTGGNGGIGKGIARGFAGAGADIVIAARNPKKTAEAASDIVKEYGRRVLEIEVDICQEEAVDAMVEKTLAFFGQINILVNNAGISIYKSPQDLSSAEYDEVLSTNLRAAFLCSKAVYPAMKKAGAGKIVNIGSMASIFGGGKILPYVVSKTGIVGMTRSLAAAWAPDNIQVNAILPGWIDTDMTRKARSNTVELNDRVLDRTLAGRWGNSEELQGTAIYLASAASDFVTGVSLPVDGGYSINM